MNRVLMENAKLKGENTVLIKENQKLEEENENLRNEKFYNLTEMKIEVDFYERKLAEHGLAYPSNYLLIKTF